MHSGMSLGCSDNEKMTNRWLCIFKVTSFFSTEKPLLFPKSYCVVCLFSFWDLCRVGVWHKWKSWVMMTYLFLRKQPWLYVRNFPFEQCGIVWMFGTLTFCGCIGNLLKAYVGLHYFGLHWHFFQCWYLQQNFININTECITTARRTLPGSGTETLLVKHPTSFGQLSLVFKSCIETSLIGALGPQLCISPASLCTLWNSLQQLKAAVGKKKKSIMMCLLEFE